MRAILVVSFVAAGATSVWAQPSAGSADGSGSDVQEITPDEPVKPPPPPPPPPTLPVPPTPVRTMDEMLVPQNRLRFTIHFFGDTSFLASSQSDPHTHFELGSLVLHFLGELSPSVDALTEDVIETNEQGLKAEVEQLAIRWKYGPGTLEVGRFHTDIGYWNTGYHHGLWLQTPIERPHVLRFEDDGGLVPVHWVGAHYTLQLPVGDGNVRIVLGVANGRGDTKEDVQVISDTNDAKAVLLKLRVKTGALELGFGGIYDRIAPAGVAVRPALPDQRIDELDGNAYGVIRTETLLLIAEGYVFTHIAGAQSWTTLAGVGLFGFKVLPWWEPYVEVDAIRADNADPFFSPMPGGPSLSVYESIVGSRFEVSTWSAVKIEGRLTRTDGKADDYAVVGNWSFGL